MNYIEQLENEIRQAYMIRNSKNQKRNFREFLTNKIENYQLVESGNKKSTNLISNNIDICDIILTAHYDTPKNVFFIYYFIQRKFEVLFGIKFAAYAALLFYILIFVLLLKINYIAFSIFALLYIIDYLSCIIQKHIGRNNKYNMMDNTSGVIALLSLAQTFQGNKKVGFIFFDNEEKGFKGSKWLKKHYCKNQYNFKDKTIINLDCISGTTNTDILMVSYNKSARESKMRYLLQDNSVYITKAIKNNDNFDYKKFRKNCSLSLSLQNKSIIFGYYLPLIHSNRDREFLINNEECVCGIVYRAINKFLEDECQPLTMIDSVK